MKMLIKEGVLLMRNGKRVRPEIGKSFDLTDDEIKDIMKVRPQAIAKVPVVETDPNSDDSGKADKGSKGGKKADAGDDSL